MCTFRKNMSIFLHYPTPILKHPHIPHIHTLNRDENIDMKPLDFGFWELLSVESVLLSEGEMNSHLSFVEVYVG